MHDSIHRELQKARVADFHRAAQQDRLARDASRHLRVQALNRLLAVLNGYRSALHGLAAQARTIAAPPLKAPADLSSRRVSSRPEA